MKQLSDLTAPVQVQRKMLEADVQKQCVDWARARGYWARKFSSISQRSVPDYLFSRAVKPLAFANNLNATKALKFACEFKRPGAKRDPITGLMSTEAQQEEQAEMRNAGWYVFECDDFEAFKTTVEQYERENVL